MLPELEPGLIYADLCAGPFTFSIKTRSRGVTTDEEKDFVRHGAGTG